MDPAMIASATDESRSAGAVIRFARLARGLTQEQLGQMIGYSASAMSRIERSQLRVRDIVVLRRLAQALAINPEFVGVSPSVPRHAPYIDGNLGDLGHPGGGAMERRLLLLGTAGLAGDAFLHRGSFVSTDTHASAAHANATHTSAAAARAALAQACFEPAAPRRASLAMAHGWLRTANRCFASGDYRRAAAELAQVLSVGPMLAAEHPDRSDAYVMLAHTYALATEILTKIGGTGLTPMTADRAVAAARISGSPVALAVATRQLTIVLRRTGHIRSALRLALDAADRLRGSGINTPGATACYARALCTSAYVAASAGNRDLAVDLIRDAAEAARVADHRCASAPERFQVANVDLYSIGVHHALGDAGAAVTATTRVRPAQLPTAERRARYWADTARAWNLYGRPEHAFRAAVAAWREAPGEIRDRDSMRGLVAGLMRHEDRLPGLRSFAATVDALT